MGKNLLRMNSGRSLPRRVRRGDHPMEGMALMDEENFNGDSYL